MPNTIKKLFKPLFAALLFTFSLPSIADKFSDTLKLAEQGNTNAQNILGLMYEYGKGVKQDKYKAKEYFGLACDNGDQGSCDAYRKLNEQGY